VVNLDHTLYLLQLDVDTGATIKTYEEITRGGIQCRHNKKKLQEVAIAVERGWWGAGWWGLQPRIN
jgi:hypothetical protein